MIIRLPLRCRRFAPTGYLRSHKAAPESNLPSDVTINGSTSPVHDRSCVVEDSGLYRLQTGRRVTDPGTIRSVYFTVPIPGDGAYALRYPKFITADDDPAIYVTTRWLIYDGSTYSDFTGTFREGDSLYLYLSFRCTDPARHFYTDGSHWLATAVYINGKREGECLIIDNATVNVNATVPGWAIFDFDGDITMKDVLRAQNNSGA